MIISEQHKFAFVHIPKCAGSTVRSCLRKYHSCQQNYFESIIELPGVGPVDAGHMTLRRIKAYFPEDYQKILAYDTFAVVRDPFYRFPSSLYQHLSFYGSRPVRELTKQEFLAGLESAINYLERGHDILDNKHVHFQRQKDYIYLDSRRIVRHLYTPDTLQPMLSEISLLIGEQLTLPDRIGESLAYKPGVAGTFARKLSFFYGSPFGIIAPRSLVNFAKRRLMHKPADLLNDILESNDVKDFIAEYYKEDIGLYHSVKSSFSNLSRSNA